MTHLCTRSYYSLLNGTLSIKELVSLAKENGMTALGLSERHGLYSALEFQSECDKQGIKPIFGLEISMLDDDLHFDSQIIAKNERGYQCLIECSYQLHQNNPITWSMLEAYHDDIIFIVFTEGGPFEGFFLNKEHEKIEEYFVKLKSQCPHIYLGVSHQESNYFRKNNEFLLNLAKQYGMSAIALPKVYYQNQGDHEVLRVLHAIKAGTHYDDKNLVSAPNRYFYSKKEMLDLYGESLLKGIEEIVESVDLDIKTLRTSLPVFEPAKEVGSDLYLQRLASLGLNKRLNGRFDDVYTQRLNHELEIITSMNFSDYFLIVYDIIRYAKKEGIYVGPGRGSSAGSLVAYCLGITEVDPLEFGLYFERFLNPSRQEMPDIDIDFPDDKRDQVIDYVRKTYGDDYVAHIVTFGTLKARQSFRDVARVFQMPIHQVDKITKHIHSQNLLESYESSQVLQRLINESPTSKKVYETALKIQGVPRHTSLHAAGIVLSSRPLHQFAPYFHDENVGSVVQYDMVRLEEIGLIKIDFLGLRNLSIIDNICNDIPGFDLGRLPMDDQKTFELLSRGETLGLFQLESEGMTQLLKDMKPYRFLDLVDAIALYRPGPMENIPTYLKNRKNPSAIPIIHEDIQTVTESSYGILVYQEQIMQVAQIMAGFSLAKADILRKAMSKKDAVELASLKVEFIEQGIKRGYEEKLVIEVYDLIMRFADYGFNKSHSVAYANIAYQMAYLKTHYPLQFYQYLLNSVQASSSKTAQYLNECKARSIKVINPSIQISTHRYELIDECLVLPLTLIKGISLRSSQIIAKERENGDFKSYYDAISRLNLLNVSNRQFISLIQGGALDCFNQSRVALQENLDEALTYSSLIKVNKGGNFILDRSLVSEPIFKKIDENPHQLLEHEKDVLGFYLSDHPTRHLQEKHRTDELNQIQEGHRRYKVIAMVDTIKKHKTKKGDQMAFLKLSDASGDLDAIVFPNLYARVEEQIEIGAIIYVKASMRERGKIILEDLYRFE
ncbi:DNA polymerase III subunit alpha [Erysipelothrix urinaevulpis]|uniref:DNA polymerase III subunit alpha n=1 Tax=Erysipelothrix urinaevulpis TaxID=2683717 RepID=UPI00135B5359|nr:DNA polymerase III subunit alpha [Erysipelothrix urinaevulpis]